MAVSYVLFEIRSTRVQPKCSALHKDQYAVCCKIVINLFLATLCRDSWPYHKDFSGIIKQTTCATQIELQFFSKGKYMLLFWGGAETVM